MASMAIAPALVEIADDPVIPGSEYEGKVRPSRQHAYMHQNMRYPTPFTIVVPDTGPHRPGYYLIGGNVFRPGQYGLDFVGKELTLIPVDEGFKKLNELMGGK